MVEATLAAQVEGDHREAVAVVKRLETTMTQLKLQTATLSKPINRRRTLLNVRTWVVVLLVFWSLANGLLTLTLASGLG